MKPVHNGALSEAYLYAQAHDLLDGPLGAAVGRCFTLGVIDPFVGQELLGRVQRHQWNAQLGRGVPFRAVRTSGGLVLGHDAAGGGRVCTEVAGLCRHGLVLGSTGSGKSNFITIVLLQLMAGSAGVLVTDSYKQEFRQLRPVLARAGVDLAAVTVHQLRWNPLQPPPGVGVEAHKTMVVGVLARTLNLGDRGRAILRWACEECYRQNAARRPAWWPTLIDVYELIRSTPGLNGSARESILDHLGNLIASLTPAVVAWRHAWTVRTLFARPLVLEQSCVSDSARTFLNAMLVQSPLVPGFHDPEAMGDLKQLLVFDDAQRLLAGAASGEGDLSPLTEAMGLLRSTRTGCVFCAQSLESVPRGLLANLSMRVLLRPGLAGDLQVMAAEMGLSKEQTDWARRLEAGAAIVQFAETGWREPIALRVPLARIPRTPDIQELHADLGVNEPRPSVPASEQFGWRQRPVIVVDSKSAPHEPAPLPTPEPVASPAQTASTSPALTPSELALLRAILEHPAKPWSRYPKLAGLSPKRATPIRDDLIRRGFLKAHKVAMSEAGRPAIVLEPLELARQAVGNIPAFKETSA